MASIEQDTIVRFAGPARAGRCWPRQGELGVVHAMQGEAIFVEWERAPGSVAWPEAWLVRVAEHEPERA